MFSTAYGSAVADPPDLFLRAHREAARPPLTPSALARKAGVSRQTIWRLETGETDRVDFETLRRLERALGVGRGDLFKPPAL